METMKRLFFAIVALTVMFAVGCSKEEFETLAPEYKLVVNMEQASFGDDTRSPRTGWEDGDEVVVVFNGDVREDKVVRYLKLTYTLATNSWSSEWVGTTLQEVAAKETKTCVASYHSLGVDNVYCDSSNTLMISASWNISGELNNLGGCVLLCDNGTFTVSQDGVVTLNIKMQPACVQYTIRNISANDALWKLSLIKEGATQAQEVYVGTSVKPDNVLSTLSHKSSNSSMYGHYNKDGVAFFLRYTPPARKGNYTFRLTDGTSTYTRVFYISSTQKGQAIIMNGPFDENGNRNEDWTKVE